MRAGQLLVVLAAAALAGCAAPVGGVAASQHDGGIPADWPERALAAGPGHDHQDPAEHLDRSTRNFELVAQARLEVGGYACGGSGARPDGSRLIVAQSRSEEVSLSFIDVTQPGAPRVVSEVQLVGARSYDATLTPDGMHALVGTYPPGGFAMEPTPPPAVSFVARNGCGGDRVLSAGVAPGLFPGVIVLGLADPASPTFEGFFPLPLMGAHSISTAQVDGETLVLAAVSNIDNALSYFQLFRLLDEPAVALEPLSIIPVQRPVSETEGAANGHGDGEIRRHPVTGRLLAYLAMDDVGLQVYDITDGRSPERVATWQDGASAFSPGAVHTVLPIDGLWEGRHVTFVGQEVLSKPAERGSGWVYALDTTDPSAPTELARWSLPDIPRWSALTFSTHYFALSGRMLYVAMYHGGVWALDASDPGDLGSVGVYVPEEELAPSIAWVSGSPTVLDVFALEDGAVAAIEAGSGLHVLRFDASDPAPRR